MSSSSSWDESSNLERVLQLSAGRRDADSGHRVHCRVVCFDLFATLAQLVFMDATLTAVWTVVVYPATVSNVTEKLRAFGAGEIFTALGFPGADGVRRLAADLHAALVARSARTLFRVLRRRAFRHRVVALVRTKLLLGHSRVFCDLSADLLRAFSAWL